MQDIKEDKPLPVPSFSEALRFWFKLGWISFGGTTGHIAIMHDFLVEKKKWISERRFMYALNACMLLPGPEGQQLAIYSGWKLHGIKGGVTAGVLFVLPSLLILLLLSILYAIYGNNPVMMAMFAGLKPAVLAIILHATWKVGQKALHGMLHYIVAAVSFTLSYFMNVPMPWIILGVILSAIAIHLIAPGAIQPDKKKEVADAAEQSYYINMHQQAHPVIKRTLIKQLLYFLVLWLIPFLLLSVMAADAPFWRRLSTLFTRTAFFTIGGSYTVIPYVANMMVNQLGWLSKTQMIDGFALAETTPGPLVIVLVYTGFMAAFNHFGGSLLMGTLGLLITGYFTFLPNFLFIFVGAPLIESSQKSQVIQAVLSLITATVVGVIVNLAFYLGKDILFSGQAVALRHTDWIALGWVLVALLLQIRYRLNVLYLVFISLLFGMLRYFLR